MPMKASGPKASLGPRPKLGTVGSNRADDKAAAQKKGREAKTNNPPRFVNLYGVNGFKGRLS